MEIVCYKHKHIPFGDFRRKDRDPDFPVFLPAAPQFLLLYDKG
jgi:hypothetical protein